MFHWGTKARIGIGRCCAATMSFSRNEPPTRTTPAAAVVIASS